MPNRPDPDFDYTAALEQCAAGRRSALEALYRQEGPRLLGVAQRIVRDRARAEDIVHDAFGWRDSAGRIGPCLEQLEPVRRNCVLHAYVEGLSHSEIAQRLGAPLGTVKAWIKRSLKALKECLA